MPPDSSVDVDEQVLLGLVHDLDWDVLVAVFGHLQCSLDLGQGRTYSRQSKVICGSGYALLIIIGAIIPFSPNY